MRIRRTIDSVEMQMSRASNTNDWLGIGFSSNVFMGMDDIYYWYYQSTRLLMSINLVTVNS